MDWPIATEDFEDLTFDYTPEELGIDTHSAAKIEEIKRLRPFTVDQPWGIFFVKFEPKRLPIVALRRILNSVAAKKRASANSAERVSWELDDLLFVSNYGEGQERQISLAHFSKPSGNAGLPVLKVLGWDNRDTALHLDTVATELSTKLTWPQDETDTDGWRKRWRSAFTLGEREVIRTARDLSIRLAELARDIRSLVNTALAIETERGPLTKLLKAFQEAFAHDLDADGFADMYAQTIAYGLLSARIVDPKNSTLDGLSGHMRTSPFLSELMVEFLREENHHGEISNQGIDFDETGISEVVEMLDNANMDAVLRDFGDQNLQEDPVIHFYESFLSAYDKQLKIQRGVFYTPRPIVSYIVRNVHEILQTEFGLVDGLADITTWGQMLNKHPGLTLPHLTDEPGEKLTISPDEPFVQIIDPATGTGTFLIEVIDVIHQTLVAKWNAEGLNENQQSAAWNDYVPDHLLPRLYAFELMMAPYAIAHMKIGLKLAETGYHFAVEERARIYLTNALDPWSQQLPLIGLAALAHETVSVNEVKKNKRFTVVIGNPPYSKLSANLEPRHRKLVDIYRNTDGGHIIERGALALEMNLQDDYVKFIRLGQLSIDASGFGVLGFITNHGYLTTPTLRGMRYSLCKFFEEIRVLDLHGNSAKGERALDGSPDNNVFDIQQGVAIGLFSRMPSRRTEVVTLHADLYGTREYKYSRLAEMRLTNESWKKCLTSAPLYKFTPDDATLLPGYENWASVADALDLTSDGIITARDGLVLAFSESELLARIVEFRDSEGTGEEVCELFGISPRSAGFDPNRAIRSLRSEADLAQYIIKIQHRPFDYRYLFYHKEFVQSMRWPVTSQLSEKGNLLLAVTRQVNRPKYEHTFVSRHMFEKKTVSHDRNTQVFPILFQPASGGLPLGDKIHGNWSRSFCDEWERLTGDNPRSVGAALQPLSYIYGILHSPTYRLRYFPLLRSDFPRIPFPATNDLLGHVARLGSELVSLHLLESPKVDNFITSYGGPMKPRVVRVGWSDGTVWFDAGKTSAREHHRATNPGSIGFHGVPVEVWDFQIGGYQVCHKWLSDRKGRMLSKDDLAHYQKIVVALTETIRIMGEIDEIINQYGGWPGAFIGT
ncbi:MAG: hypothetical protein CL785_05455 [Chloroflexi bacterium]|nr:hypothetical protein [Chloroflexota bacterium]